LTPERRREGKRNRLKQTARGAEFTPKLNITPTDCLPVQSGHSGREEGGESCDRRRGSRVEEEKRQALDISELKEIGRSPTTC